jgi:TRAP-type C4-dicarboxylate transport system permease small subunit
MTAHDLDTAPSRALRRLLAVLAVLALIVVSAPAAWATEEVTAPAQEERLTYEQLQRESSQRAQEFFPEAYEEPSFFQWISVPVLLGGLMITVALLFAYLWWQPRFAAERREKQRQRR